MSENGMQRDRTTDREKVFHKSLRVRTYFSHIFLADANPDGGQVFHSVMHETEGCRLESIINAGYARGYWSGRQAQAEGFKPCPRCLPDGAPG